MEMLSLLFQIPLYLHPSDEKERYVLHDVISAIYQGDHLIELEFDDGQRGTVDFAKYLERRGVFERFRDLEFFQSFAINKELGILTWGNDIDIAPETLYAEATGTPLPAWTNPEKEPRKN